MMLALFALSFLSGCLVDAFHPQFQKQQAAPPPWDCSDGVKYNMSADGYHWTPSYNLLKEQYVEWWFFYFIDAANNIAVDMSYAVRDPGNLFGNGNAAVIAMVYPQVYGTPTMNVSSTNVGANFALSQFSAVPNNATVSLGASNAITVLDEYTYQVVGEAQGVAWNLTFTQLADAMEEIMEVPEVLQLDWISYMPAARVDGTLDFAGRTLQVADARGYHDHNFGYWPEPIFPWVWANMHAVSNSTGKLFAMVMGAYPIPLLNDTYIGYVIVRYGSQHIKIGTLCGDDFSLVTQEFVPWDGHPGKRIAVHNAVAAENRQYRVVFDYKTRVWAYNPGGKPMGLLVSEQISAYNVQLYERDAGSWSLVDEFAGDGFNEWCDTMF